MFENSESIDCTYKPHRYISTLVTRRRGSFSLLVTVSPGRVSNHSYIICVILLKICYTRFFIHLDIVESGDFRIKIIQFCLSHFSLV